VNALQKRLASPEGARSREIERATPPVRPRLSPISGRFRPGDSSRAFERELARTDPDAGAVATWEWTVRFCVFAGLAAMTYGVVFRPLIHATLAEAARSSWRVFLERPSLLWVAMGTLLIGVRTLLWAHYRPAPPASFAEAARLTVVIPAYNEGPMVAQSIDSAACATYPPGRLEILVIDDGSTDDTWQHIASAAARHGSLVRAIRFARNRGKRAALAAGFEQAKGAIVVTLDSDSVLEPGALMALAGPFRDPKVGAVAGKVAVYNRREGIIPRMLHVRFILSFDLLRAVQSTYGTVYCCPGAISAYRTSAVRRVLVAWMGQTFLGAPCTYGEDRALTNAMFAEGFDTKYQRSAVVYTVVPTTYVRLCRMFLRWDRSYVREEILFARIVWKRPLVARVLALLDTATTNLRYPVGLASFVFLLAIVVHDPAVLLRVFAAIGLMSLFNMLYFLRSERSWAFLYGVLYSYFSFVALFWIFPYAVLTVRSRSWMTR
jgi:hyaluronan synthase